MNFTSATRLFRWRRKGLENNLRNPMSNLLNTNIKEIETLANDLLDKDWIDPKNKSLLLPVNPIVIAQKEGVAVVGIHTERIEPLFSRYHSSRKNISYDLRLNDAERRFVVARALGRHLLGHIGVFEDAGFVEKKSGHLFTQATLFAANLLMPSSSVREITGTADTVSLGLFTSLFGVTEELAKWRLVLMGYKIREEKAND